jgi:hypothetical protein
MSNFLTSKQVVFFITTTHHANKPDRRITATLYCVAVCLNAFFLILVPEICYRLLFAADMKCNFSAGDA